MNTQQLLVFTEVMKSGSVSAAARTLGRTQPAVSASLKTLENLLGTTLFVREGKRLNPVPEAHYLYAEAIKILEQLKSTEAHFKETLAGNQSTLKLLAMPGPTSYLFPEFLSNYISEKPDLDVIFSTRSSSQIFNLISSQDYDLGFCDATISTKENHLINSITISGECRVAVLHDHELAQKEVISIEDLSNVPMGTLLPDHHIVQKLQKLFDSKESIMNAKVRTQFFLPLLNFVENSGLCAVVDPLSVHTYQKLSNDQTKVKFIPLNAKLSYDYAIITPAKRPSSITAQNFQTRWINFIKPMILNNFA